MFHEPSKYQPLQRHLTARRERELPMTFGDVERVLGFSLPPSARKHPAWWSNNRGTNVAVKAWRDAGRHTSRVNIAAERVVFVRDEVEPVTRAASPAGEPATITLQRESLSPVARRLLEDYAEEKNCDLGKAAAEILDSVALERRRLLVERFILASPRVAGDSTDLIREDRDAR
jgi:hypothetical protein